MDRKKLEARLQVIAEEAAELLEEQRTALDRPEEERTDEHEEAYEANESRLDELKKERVKIEGQLTRLSRMEKLAADEKNLVEGVSFNVNTPKDPFDLNDIRWNSPVSELRARARTAIEEVSAGYLSDAQREGVTRKLETTDDPRGVVANLILRTGNEHYRKAFQKALAGKQDLWTTDERQAMAAVEEYRTAMSLTTGNGCAAVPFTLDPTLILTNAGSTNPIRQIAKNVSITTDAWNGVTSAGVTAQWLAENTAATDASPTFVQPNIPVYKAAAFVQGSIEIVQDYQAIEADLAMAIADGKDNLEAAAFVTGPGSTAPTGIVTALAGGSSVVAPATPETFAVADLYAISSALPPRHRGGASWVAELSTINAIRQFATANNYHAFLTDMVGGSPARLLGQPLYDSSAMSAFSAVNPAATDATNYILLYGDFRNYVIVDRVGMSLEFIPHLFSASGATTIPTGTRGWFAHWRVGADSVNDDAFRLLNIETAA